MILYSVDYGLEQKYFVEKNAFLQSIMLTNEYVKNVKILSYDVEIQGQDLLINLDVKVKKTINLNVSILDLQEAIEDSIYSLIDVKPTNIKIDIKGFY